MVNLAQAERRLRRLQVANTLVDGIGKLVTFAREHIPLELKLIDIEIDYIVPNLT